MGAPVLIGQFLGQFGDDIGHGHQLRTLETGDGLRVVPTDDTASQNTETQFFDGHISSPPVFVRDGSCVRGALSRTISSGLSKTSLSPPRPLMRSRSILADLAPMPYLGTLRVVSAGDIRRANIMSSHPTTAISAGTPKPSSAKAFKAPTATTSL